MIEVGSLVRFKLEPFHRNAVPGRVGVVVDFYDEGLIDCFKIMFEDGSIGNWHEDYLEELQ